MKNNKKPITFYVDKNIFNQFKDKCLYELNDTMKNVVLVMVRAFNYKSDEHIENYLSRIIDSFQHKISSKEDNMHRFRVRTTDAELHEFKKLANKYNITLSKLICVIMKVVVININPINYKSNKDMVEKELPSLDYFTKIDVAIQDKELNNLIQNYIIYKYIDDNKNNITTEQLNKVYEEKLNNLVIDAIREYLIPRVKEIESSNNPINYLTSI